MAKILTQADLYSRLDELLSKSNRVDVAMAWSRHGRHIDQLSNFGKSADKKLRVITGVHDYITSPQALEQLLSVGELKIAYGTSGKKFHAKYILFYGEESTVCWVGSANLTTKAFTENIEIVSEFEDDGALQSIFESWWTGKDVNTPQIDWLERYASDYADIAKQPLAPMRPDLGPPSASHIHSIETWNGYLSVLKATDISRIDDIIDLLKVSENLLNWDWADLTFEQGNILLGLKPYMVLGNMKQAAIAPEIFRSKDEKNRQIRLRIHDALKQINRDAQHADFDNSLWRAFKWIEEEKGLGTSIITRILALTRPDICVSLNRKSIESLSARSRIDSAVIATPEGYLQLVQWIRAQAWWLAPQPIQIEDQLIWENRAALQDIIAYRDWEINHPEKPF